MAFDSAIPAREVLNLYYINNNKYIMAVGLFLFSTLATHTYTQLHARTRKTSCEIPIQSKRRQIRLYRK